MTDRPLSTPGRRPYGTQDGEAYTLRLILRRRSAGWTWQSIADALNDSGRMRRNGTPWTAGAVASIHANAVGRGES